MAMAKAKHGAVQRRKFWVMIITFVIIFMAMIMAYLSYGRNDLFQGNIYKRPIGINSVQASIFGADRYDFDCQLLISQLGNSETFTPAFEQTALEQISSTCPLPVELSSMSCEDLLMTLNNTDTNFERGEVYATMNSKSCDRCEIYKSRISKISESAQLMEVSATAVNFLENQLQTLNCQ